MKSIEVYLSHLRLMELCKGYLENDYHLSFSEKVTLEKMCPGREQSIEENKR